MIINRKELKNKQAFKDNRGEVGSSGQLFTLEDKAGKKYLVKTRFVDVLNEYVAHSLAKIIGVPTLDAVLIKGKANVWVGIEFLSDFTYVGLCDFFGLENYREHNIPLHMNGKLLEPLKIPELKYSDDSPLLADVMAYCVFRGLIDLWDIEQLAFSRGRIISFDYAESFCLNDVSMKLMLCGVDISDDINDNIKDDIIGKVIGKISWPFNAFRNALDLNLNNAYEKYLRLLRRADSDFLRKAYWAPMRKFLEADFSPIINELKTLFFPVISDFYDACFEEIRSRVKKALEEA